MKKILFLMIFLGSIVLSEEIDTSKDLSNLIFNKYDIISTTKYECINKTLFYKEGYNNTTYLKPFNWRTNTPYKCEKMRFEGVISGISKIKILN